MITAVRRTCVLVCAVAALSQGLVGLTASGAQASSRPSAVIGTRVLGHSVDGRKIMAYHLGNPHARTRAVVLGQMHGDEHAGVRIAKAFLRGKPVAGINLWVVPTMNPDGNAANTRANAHGVDLNRNWPHKWVRDRTRCYTGTDPLSRASGCNSGRRPLSEPESRAMYKFLRAFRPTLMVSIHQPLDGVDTTDGGHRDPAFRNRLSRGLHLPAKPLRCFSTCHGNLTGWVTQHQSGAAITVEFGFHPTRNALRHTAPRAILAAFGGRYAHPSR